MDSKKAFLLATNVFEKMFYDRTDSKEREDCVQIVLFWHDGDMLNKVRGNPHEVPEAIGRFIHGYAKSLNLDIADVLTRLIMSAYESFKNDVEVEHEFK